MINDQENINKICDNIEPKDLIKDFSSGDFFCQICGYNITKNRSIIKMTICFVNHLTTYLSSGAPYRHKRAGKIKLPNTNEYMCCPQCNTPFGIFDEKEIEKMFLTDEFKEF